MTWLQCLHNTSKKWPSFSPPLPKCGAHLQFLQILIDIRMNESPWNKQPPKAYLHRVKMQVVADVKFHLPPIFITLMFAECLGWTIAASKKVYKHQKVQSLTESLLCLFEVIYCHPPESDSTFFHGIFSRISDHQTSEGACWWVRGGPTTAIAHFQGNQQTHVLSFYSSSHYHPWRRHVHSFQDYQHKCALTKPL